VKHPTAKAENQHDHQTHSSLAITCRNRRSAFGGIRRVDIESLTPIPANERYKTFIQVFRQKIYRAPS